MSNFDIANIAVKMICPNNAVLIDDMGLPSVMVYIPAFKNSDVLTGGDDNTHPAFIVNGKEIPGFYYSKYQNMTHKTEAYSLPGEDPAYYMSYENAKSFCGRKGAGWHLSTNAEWAAIALWCKKNGFLPKGNNDLGKDIYENNYKAIPTNHSSGAVTRVATGTGPIEWSHDKTLAGIWDMNGNVWETQAGLRVFYGEVQIIPDNDAADPNNSENWKAINAADGSLVEPEHSYSVVPDEAVTGATVKLNFISDTWIYTTKTQLGGHIYGDVCDFDKITCDATISEAAKVLLRALALLPDENTTVADYEGATMSMSNAMPWYSTIRGGNYNGNGDIFSISQQNSGHGFRCAYIPDM